jgi:hypothetical protein
MRKCANECSAMRVHMEEVLHVTLHLIHSFWCNMYPCYDLEIMLLMDGNRCFGLAVNDTRRRVLAFCRYQETGHCQGSYKPLTTDK